jgi:hypothetical protein
LAKHHWQRWPAWQGTSKLKFQQEEGKASKGMNNNNGADHKIAAADKEQQPPPAQSKAQDEDLSVVIFNIGKLEYGDVYKALEKFGRIRSFHPRGYFAFVNYTNRVGRDKAMTRREIRIGTYDVGITDKQSFFSKGSSSNSNQCQGLVDTGAALPPPPRYTANRNSRKRSISPPTSRSEEAEEGSDDHHKRHEKKYNGSNSRRHRSRSRSPQQQDIHQTREECLYCGGTGYRRRFSPPRKLQRR